MLHGRPAAVTLFGYNSNVNEQNSLAKLGISSSSRKGHTQHLLQLGVNALLLSLWLWLYRPVFEYLKVIFQREEFRTNQIVLLGMILLIGLQIKREGIRPRLTAAPRPNRLALVITLVCSILFLLVERFLDINTLAACLFALASYGLLGLWLSPQRWRQGLPAVLLLIGVLPFGEHLQTFVGYPMRIFTAELVRSGLAAIGIDSIGVDTILVFENGVSHVDLPCSGVKSLWTGMLFLLAATWVEGRPLNRRWLLVALLFIPILFLANLLRVAILVVVGQVLGLELLAEMLHVPLGVLGFVLACGTAVGLLRWGKTEDRQAINRLSSIHRPINRAKNGKFRSIKPDLSGAARLARCLNLWRSWQSPHWLSFILIVSVMVMIQLYAPRPQTGLAGQVKNWVFPAELQVEPLPLKPDENEWLTRDGAEAAERLRFNWGDLSGSMILITSKTWRAHHRPERCFEVYGLSLDESRTHLVNTVMPIRAVTLSDARQTRTYSAAYWFQSAKQITDDYGTRIWADVSWERDRWVLVSILFDEEEDPQDPEVERLYLAMQEAVEGYLGD